MLCIYGGNYFSEILSAKDLLKFALISFVLVSILLFYYNKISYKNRALEEKKDTSVFELRDVFLQEESRVSNFVLIEKEISVWSKILIYGLSIVLVFTSMYELLRIDYLG